MMINGVVYLEVGQRIYVHDEYQDCMQPATVLDIPRLNLPLETLDGTTLEHYGSGNCIVDAEWHTGRSRDAGVTPTPIYLIHSRREFTYNMHYPQFAPVTMDGIDYNSDGDEDYEAEVESISVMETTLFITFRSNSLDN